MPSHWVFEEQPIRARTLRHNKREEEPHHQLHGHPPTRLARQHLGNPQKTITTQRLLHNASRLLTVQGQHQSPRVLRAQTKKLLIPNNPTRPIPHKKHPLLDRKTKYNDARQHRHPPELHAPHQQTLPNPLTTQIIPEEADGGEYGLAVECLWGWAASGSVMDMMMMIGWGIFAYG